jgi:hypothetical protein
MTLQTIAGSDYFGPVQWMESHDQGQTWTQPAPVPSLGRLPQPDGTEYGVCDVVPEYHPRTRSVLAMGHSVYYRNGKFFVDQPPRNPVYTVFKDGTWGPPHRLEWDDPRGAFIYTNGCGQRVTLSDGSIQFVMSIGATGRSRSALGVRCSFDGSELRIERVGSPITHEAGRGMLEPSLLHHGGRFYVTLRAEDQRGYVAPSDDGLHFQPKQPWCWDNGEPLDMSTTQQHWLQHSDAVFLVYTRKDASNLNVIRWRSPLWIAQVDLSNLRLIRDSERVLLPLDGDGINAPNDVPLMGNHHPVNISPLESWVCDGEMLPKHGYRGDLQLARIRWSTPNRLA